MNLALFILLVSTAAPELPAPVQATLAKRFPAAVVQRWKEERDHGKQVIEVVAKDAKGRVELSFTPDGAFLAEERVVPVTALPDAVKAAFAKSPQGARPIERVEEIHEGAEVRYELKVTLADGKRQELVYTAAGNLVEEEPAEKD